MKRVAFIGCSQEKWPGRHPAYQLYISPLFSMAWNYTSSRYDSVFILSARHGLLPPNRVIESYDFSLRDMTTAERRRWSFRVAWEIEASIPCQTELHFFCGDLYRRFLIPLLSVYHCEAPLRGLRIGQQLQWYRKHS